MTVVSAPELDNLLECFPAARVVVREISDIDAWKESCPIGITGIFFKDVVSPYTRDARDKGYSCGLFFPDNGFHAVCCFIAVKCDVLYPIQKGDMMNDIRSAEQVRKDFRDYTPRKLDPVNPGLLGVLVGLLDYNLGGRANRCFCLGWLKYGEFNHQLSSKDLDARDVFALLSWVQPRKVEKTWSPREGFALEAALVYAYVARNNLKGNAPYMDVSLALKESLGVK